MFQATSRPQPSTLGGLSSGKQGRKVGEENVDQIVTIEMEDVGM